MGPGLGSGASRLELQKTYVLPNTHQSARLSTIPPTSPELGFGHMSVGASAVKVLLPARRC